jgi:hypothetical protein
VGGIVLFIFATDNGENSGVKEIHYTLSGATQEEQTILGDTTLIYYAVDNNEGNQEFPQSVELKLDKTSLTINPIISLEPNSYICHNTDVVVFFIKTLTNPTTITGEGKNQYIGGESVDHADNRVTTYTRINNIDKTPSSVTITAVSDIFWPLHHRMVDATISGEAQDSLLGISSNNIFKVRDEYRTVKPVISVLILLSSLNLGEMEMI